MTVFHNNECDGLAMKTEGSVMDKVNNKAGLLLQKQQ